MEEYPAGDTQVVVTYRTDAWEDIQGGGYSGSFLTFVANDAATRAQEGWRIAAWDTLSSGFSGTAANMLFNTGGGFATDVVVTVTYRRDA